MAGRVRLLLMPSYYFISPFLCQGYSLWCRGIELRTSALAVATLEDSEGNRSLSNCPASQNSKSTRERTDFELDRRRLLQSLLLPAGAWAAWTTPAQGASVLTPLERQLADSFTPEMPEGHVRFLASDLLEGRDTPSRGLDIAAEYLAAQFRRMGLQPADQGSYFQVAPYRKTTQPAEGTFVSIRLENGKSWESSGQKMGIFSPSATNLENLPIWKHSLKDPKAPLPTAEQIAGKVLLLFITQGVPGLGAKRAELLALKPAAVLTPGFVPNQPFRLRPADAPPPLSTPQVVVSDSEFTKLLGDLPDGALAASATVRSAAPVEEEIALKNVVAVLPGSDQALRKEVVILSAHYDHTGLVPRGEDRINNGANDDASGVATLLSLAEAFARLPEKPRRSLLFMAYFGEEKGLLGSTYYTRHPLFPLADTVANLNFEHIGRTDDSEGPSVRRIMPTGADFSTVGDLLKAAADATGVTMHKHPVNSDAFFGRSDNQALADAGVPAHTICVGFIFPDYHRPGDHWDKLDYKNMRDVLRTFSVATLRLANQNERPVWNADNPKTEPYRKAHAKLLQK